MEEVKKSPKQDITDEEATRLIMAFVSDPVAFMKIHSNPSITELFTNKTVIAKLGTDTLKKIINTPYITTNAHQTRAKEYYKLAAEIIIQNKQLVGRLPSEFIRDICVMDEGYATEIMKVADTIPWTNEGYIGEIATKWPKLRQVAANIRQGVSVNTVKGWLTDGQSSPEARVILLMRYIFVPEISVDFWMTAFNKLSTLSWAQEGIVKKFLGPEVGSGIAKRFIEKFYYLGFFTENTALMQMCLLKPDYAGKVVSLYRTDTYLQNLIKKNDIAKLQFFSWINNEHTRNNTSIDRRTVGNIIAKLLHGVETSLIEYDDLSSTSTKGDSQGSAQTTTGPKDEKKPEISPQKKLMESAIKEIFSKSSQLDEAGAHRLIVYIFKQQLKKPTFIDDFCREVDKLVAFKPICSRIRAIQKFWMDLYKPSDISKFKDPVNTIVNHYNTAHRDEAPLLPPPALNPELDKVNKREGSKQQPLVLDTKEGRQSFLESSQPSSLSLSSGSSYSSPPSSSFSRETKGEPDEPLEGIASLPSPSAPMDNKQSVIDDMTVAWGDESPLTIINEILDNKKTKFSPNTLSSDSFSRFFAHPKEMKGFEKGEEPEPGSKPKPDVEIAKEFLGYDRGGNRLGWVQSKEVSLPIYDAEGNFHGFVPQDRIREQPVLVKSFGNEGEDDDIAVEEDFDNSSLEQGEPSDVVDSDKRLEGIIWGR